MDSFRQKDILCRFHCGIDYPRDSCVQLRGSGDSLQGRGADFCGSGPGGIEPWPEVTALKRTDYSAKPDKKAMQKPISSRELSAHPNLIPAAFSFKVKRNVF